MVLEGFLCLLRVQGPKKPAGLWLHLLHPNIVPTYTYVAMQLIMMHVITAEEVMDVVMKVRVPTSS